MSPSDIPWWGWFVCAISAWTICGVVGLFAAAATNEDGEGSSAVMLANLISLSCALGGVLAAVIGVIRFTKWVWVG